MVIGYVCMYVLQESGVLSYDWGCAMYYSIHNQFTTCLQDPLSLFPLVLDSAATLHNDHVQNIHEIPPLLAFICPSSCSTKPPIYIVYIISGGIPVVSSQV